MKIPVRKYQYASGVWNNYTL